MNRWNNEIFNEFERKVTEHISPQCGSGAGIGLFHPDGHHSVRVAVRIAAYLLSGANFKTIDSSLLITSCFARQSHFDASNTVFS